MKSGGIEAVQNMENEMLECLRQNDYSTFASSFSEYFFTGHESPSFLRFKAIGLLFYLSRGDYVSYYKLLQSLRMDDLKNENIRMVFSVEDLVNKSDLHGIEELGKNKNEEIIILLRNLYKNQKETQKKIIEERIDFESTNKIMDNNDLQDIEDTLFVSKNFIDF